MEEQIVLTKEEMAVIKKYFNGETSMFGTPQEDMIVMSRVINKASALLSKLGEDVGDDLIEWFMTKYNAQNKIK